jgi:hypothetical protein
MSTNEMVREILHLVDALDEPASSATAYTDTAEYSVSLML